MCGSGELLPAVAGQCLLHSHHSGQDKPAPLAPAVPGTAPPCRVSLARLPQAEFTVLGPVGSQGRGDAAQCRPHLHGVGGGLG